jgi:hypothetical protein
MRMNNPSYRHTAWARTINIIVLATLMLLEVSPGGQGSPSPAHAASDRFDEYSVKAAYLYNFAKFVVWPDSSFSSVESPLTICVVGFDPFKENLDYLENKSVRGRQIAIKRLDKVDGISDCHTVFVSREEREAIRSVIDAVKNKPILTVGETSDFCPSGGIVNLYNENNRVRFEIDVTAAEQAGLTISSELLKLAVIRRGGK